jgi:hypothetical protein
MSKSKVSPGKKAMLNESKALESHGKKLVLNPTKQEAKKKPETKEKKKEENAKDPGQLWYKMPPKPKFGGKKPTKNNVPGAY